MMNMSIDTAGQQPAVSAVNKQPSYWVAGLMLAGLLGLVLIGLLFRKHVEL